MRLIRLIKFYIELIKGIFRIVLYLSKKCQKLLICVLLAIFAVYLIYGFILSVLMSVVGLLYIIYNFCDYLLYNPNDPQDSRSNVLSPMAFNLPFESHFITTEDNVNINVLLVKRPDTEYKTCPTIVFFHGNAGNIGHRLQNCYELYHELGCNVLLVEYRGYGLSEGQPSERGLYLDGSAAVHYLCERPDIDSNKLILFGRSLGGAVAIDVARNVRYGSRIAALIIENTFTSLPDIARTLFNCRAVRFLPNWFYKNQYNSVSKIPALCMPQLFISGVLDELIPASMMTTLYMMSGSGNKQLHRLEGSHNFTWRCANYYHIVRAFLADVLQTNHYPIDCKASSALDTTADDTAVDGRQQHERRYHQSLIAIDDDIEIQGLNEYKTIDI